MLLDGGQQRGPVGISDLSGVEVILWVQELHGHKQQRLLERSPFPPGCHLTAEARQTAFEREMAASLTSLTSHSSTVKGHEEYLRSWISVYGERKFNILSGLDFI